MTLKKELLELIKKIDKERDKKKSDIISKFQSDKYNHKNLKHNVDGDLNFSIDKYTGKLIFNKVSAFLKQTKYKVSLDYNEDEDLLNKTIFNAFNNTGELEDKYNSLLRATSRIKSYLNFDNNPKKVEIIL